MSSPTQTEACAAMKCAYQHGRNTYREHVRLRRDGQPVPSSMEYEGNEKRDKNVEVKLPAKARIGLAGVVFLDFQAAPDRVAR